jgi:hypothetical protein
MNSLLNDISLKISEIIDVTFVNMSCVPLNEKNNINNYVKTFEYIMCANPFPQNIQILFKYKPLESLILLFILYYYIISISLLYYYLL